MIQALVVHPDATRRDTSSLRCLNYAASPISETTMTSAVELLGPSSTRCMGRASGAATMLLAHQHCPHGSERERRWMRSVGRPTPNTKVTIVDEGGDPLRGARSARSPCRRPAR